MIAVQFWLYWLFGLQQRGWASESVTELAMPGVTGVLAVTSVYMVHVWIGKVLCEQTSRSKGSPQKCFTT